MTYVIVGYTISVLLGIWLGLFLFGAAITSSQLGWRHDFLVICSQFGVGAFLIAWIFRTDWRISGALLCGPTALVLLLVGLPPSPIAALILVVFGAAWVGDRVRR